MGCASNKIITKSRLLYPDTAGVELECAAEVPVGTPQSEVEFGAYAEAQRVAGADCRDKLAGVKVWVESWPEQSSNQNK